jgi:hypothetical protein
LLLQYRGITSGTQPNDNCKDKEEYDEDQNYNNVWRTQAALHRVKVAAKAYFQGICVLPHQ